MTIKKNATFTDLPMTNALHEVLHWECRRSLPRTIDGAPIPGSEFVVHALIGVFANQARLDAFEPTFTFPMADVYGLDPNGDIPGQLEDLMLSDKLSGGEKTPAKSP